MRRGGRGSIAWRRARWCRGGGARRWWGAGWCGGWLRVGWRGGVCDAGGGGGVGGGGGLGGAGAVRGVPVWRRAEAKAVWVLDLFAALEERERAGVGG